MSNRTAINTCNTIRSELKIQHIPPLEMEVSTYIQRKMRHRSSVCVCVFHTSNTWNLISESTGDGDNWQETLPAAGGDDEEASSWSQERRRHSTCLSLLRGSPCFHLVYTFSPCVFTRSSSCQIVFVWFCELKSVPSAFWMNLAASFWEHLNSNSILKTLFYKECGLGSVKTVLTEHQRSSLIW